MKKQENNVKARGIRYLTVRTEIIVEGSKRLFPQAIIDFGGMCRIV
jgi:hypothetical protein